MSLDLKILIADDMPAVRSILRNMLENAGFSAIEEAEDGAYAWDLLCARVNKSEAFNVVISDWTMPGLSGIDLVRAVRGHPQMGDRIRFLMVTSEGDQARVVEALEAGADGYIVKPFDPAELVEKVRGEA